MQEKLLTNFQTPLIKKKKTLQKMARKGPTSTY